MKIKTKKIDLELHAKDYCFLTFVLCIIFYGIDTASALMLLL